MSQRPFRSEECWFDLFDSSQGGAACQEPDTETRPFDAYITALEPAQADGRTAVRSSSCVKSSDIGELTS